MSTSRKVKSDNSHLKPMQPKPSTKLSTEKLKQHRRATSQNPQQSDASQQPSESDTTTSIQIETKSIQGLDLCRSLGSAASWFFTKPSTDQANATSTHLSLDDVFLNSSAKSLSTSIRFDQIEKSDMLGHHWTEIDDEQLFHIGVARKECLKYPISVRHASLAFQEVNSGKFLIVGRQNAQFLKKNIEESDGSFNYWLFSNLRFGTIYHFTETNMGNEKRYSFFPGSKFDIDMTKATLTGAEIKKLLKSVDDNVCSQRYDVVHSNCYSSVFYGLSKAIECMAARTSEDLLDINNKHLKSLFSLICLIVKDNHELGFGGLDNEVIIQALNQSVEILKNNHLLIISRESKKVPNISITNIN